MSRSYKSVDKNPYNKMSINSLRNWKHNSTQIRRAKEKAQLFMLDDDNVFEVKYQKTKGLTDWSGPHDGWRREFKKVSK